MLALHLLLLVFLFFVSYEMEKMFIIVKMKRFTIRHGPPQNIAFLGLLTSIVAVFSLLCEFVPFSSLFIVLFLPSVASFAIEYSEKPYSFLFVVASLGISIALTASSFQETLFYIYPAICGGSLYGALRKHGLNVAITIFIASFLSLSLNYLAIPLVKLFYEIDMIDSILKILGLANKANIYWIVPSLIYLYSLLELGISFFFIEFINIRFSYAPPKPKIDFVSCFPFLSLGFSSLSLLLSWFYPPLAYLFLLLGFYWMIFASVSSLGGRFVFYYATMVSLFIISTFVFALYYKSMPSGTGLLLLNLFPLTLDLPLFFLNRKKKKLENKK